MTAKKLITTAATALLFFLSAAVAQPSIVTVTITGTVQLGYDANGNVFSNSGQYTDLTGASFTLVYTFDDSKGLDLAGVCNGAPPAWSMVSTNKTNPGTAALTINGGTFYFGGGGLAQSSITSSFAVQTAGCPFGMGAGFGPASFVSPSVIVNYSGSGFSSVSGIGLTTSVASFDWRNSISNAPLADPYLSLSAAANTTYAGKAYSFEVDLGPNKLNIVGPPPVMLKSFTAVGTNSLSVATCSWCVSPGPTVNVSIGDGPTMSQPNLAGDYITYIPTPATAYLNPVVTSVLTGNPMSECTTSLTLSTLPNWSGWNGPTGPPGQDGFGVSGSYLTADQIGTGACAPLPPFNYTAPPYNAQAPYRDTSPSGIFTVTVMSGTMGAQNKVTVIVPPQIMIRTLHGEAKGQNTTGDASMASVLRVAQNQIGDTQYFSWAKNFQTALSHYSGGYPDFNGVVDVTTNGHEPELDVAAAIFNNTSNVTLPAGCKCYISPTQPEYNGTNANGANGINYAYLHGTTGDGLAASMGTGTLIGPKLTCWQPNTDPKKNHLPSGMMRQLVMKASVKTSTVPSNAGVPAFVFYQLAPVGSNSVIEIP